jgi:HPt (histidine-containing phosphotransfer) domain-containing protein
LVLGQIFMHNRRVPTTIPEDLAWYSPANDDGHSPDPIEAAALGRLRRECDSSGATLSDELLELYMRELEPRITAIREAMICGDAIALTHAAHALKGSSSLIGAHPMAKLCLQLELAGRNHTIAAAPSMLTRLEWEGIRLRQALGSVLYETNNNKSDHHD